MSYRQSSSSGGTEGAFALLLFIGAVVLCLALGCKHVEPKPLLAPIVVPAGPAANAAEKAHAAQEASDAAVLSSIAASAAAISEINAGQPEGPRTDGVSNEAGIIANLAGQPTAADKLAASERARIVAEGKTEEIAKAYAKATTEAETLKARADAADAALVKAKADANAEQAASAAKLQAAIEKLTADANARVAQAIKDGDDKARAAMTHWVTVIFFGLSALFTAGGIVVLLTATSIPMFGPKAGFAILGAGVGLAAVGTAINQVQNFLYRHPWVVGTSVGVCLVALAGAGGLMLSNHFHHKAATPAPV